MRVLGVSAGTLGADARPLAPNASPPPPPRARSAAACQNFSPCPVHGKGMKCGHPVAGGGICRNSKASRSARARGGAVATKIPPTISLPFSDPPRLAVRVHQTLEVGGNKAAEERERRSRRLKARKERAWCKR